jgi:2-keto-4-pentenoate hydratase/2-oxohepta-3-ene-1,7-dioic acid hydratase in catechol pathway
MIRDGILLLDHYRNGMERLFKIDEQHRMPEASKYIPIYWKPSRATVIGPEEPIRWPKYSVHLDYAVELGVEGALEAQLRLGGRRARFR